MDYKFRFAPSIKIKRTTSQIMFELLIALLAVLAFSLVYYQMEYGLNYVIHILTMLAASLITAYAIEVLYAVATKKDIKKHLSSSYPYITSIILVLITSVNVQIYPIVISTAFAIFIGKLAFGGFGQNIFNPAGVGRIVLVTAFGGHTLADLAVGATPVSSVNAQSWTVAAGGFEKFLEGFGGWTGLLTGWHPGAIGETPAILMLILGVVLIVRQVIDWRITISYLITLFVMGLVFALIGGMDLSYGLFQVINGGAIFGAVFMLTDPVTSPVHPVGRAIFGVGAAILTFIIRLFGQTPGGVVFAIVLMNILVPMIDYLLAGNQIKTYKKAMMSLAGVAVVAVLFSTLAGNVVQVVSAQDENVSVLDVTDEGSSKVYRVESKGFNAGDKNIVLVQISGDGTVESVSFEKFADSDAEGAPARSDDFLSQFVGLDVVSEIDVDTSNSATFSSNSVLEAVKAAAAEHGGQ
ncbi:MAG TPA: RnfABCDGE type electron transport complex subunit D [Erysipelothrix sp.]|jgi:electron transport complex protein RnfD|nr:RnfABCDGE type electron transport complex subunit D [Erysipelothrix sp.]